MKCFPHKTREDGDILFQQSVNPTNSQITGLDAYHSPARASSRKDTRNPIAKTGAHTGYATSYAARTTTPADFRYWLAAVTQFVKVSKQYSAQYCTVPLK
jgi:hypothetical protein